MALNHVYHWTPNGYEYISINTACNEYKGTVQANTKIFMCSLCHQYVTLTKEGKNNRHFRHNRAEEDKDCEDRQQKINAKPVKSFLLNNQPLPLRIVVSNGHFSLEGCFPKLPKEMIEKYSSVKVIIAGAGSDLHDSRALYYTIGDRFNYEGMTFLTLGDLFRTRIFGKYSVSFSENQDELLRYYSNEIEGVDSKGTFFKFDSGKRINAKASVFVGERYYYLSKSHLNSIDGLLAHLINQRQDGWLLYDIEITKFNQGVASFFIEREIFLTQKRCAFFPIWPPIVTTPYWSYCNGDKLYFYSQSDSGIKLNSTIRRSFESNFVKCGSQISSCLLLQDRQIINFEDRSSGISENYYISKENQKFFDTDEDVIQVTDTIGNILSEERYHILPKQKRIYVDAKFDGKAKIFDEKGQTDEFLLKPKNRIPIDVKYGMVIYFYQGLECLKTICFEREPVKTQIQNVDLRMYKKLCYCYGNKITLDHHFACVLEKLNAYPLIRKWLKQAILKGYMSDCAYKILRTFLEGRNEL